MHLSPALEERRGKRASRGALNAERGVVRPEPGASAEARGVSAGRAVLCAARPPAASGKLWNPPPGSRGRGQRRQRTPPALAQPERLGSQRSGRAPRGSGRRAQSWAAGTVTPVGRILCCAPRLSGGSPKPGVPGPAASIRPESRAQREIKSPPIPLHAFGETFTAAAGARPGGGTLGRGRSAGREPQSLPAPGRVQGRDVKASPPPPSAGSPAPSPPPERPSEVTETFSCSGEGGEPLPAEGVGGCAAGVAGATAAAVGQ